MPDDSNDDAIQFLELMKQVIGVKESTFTDDASVQAIRHHLASLVGDGIPDHWHPSELDQHLTLRSGPPEVGKP